MEIKRLQDSDLKDALGLVWSVFEEFEAPDYCEEGINEFRDFIDSDSISEKINKNGIIFWGCYKDATLVGVIAILDKNHICLLFVKKEFHRHGIARRLFKTIICACKNDYSIKRITVNSSPYATEVYHRLGFVDTDNEKIINGIRFTPMEYFIT